MNKNPNNLTLISGGQTGADRAALDFAIENDISHGGWCPKGRVAEDGVLDKKYQLKETPSEEYEERTEWNIRDSDGTVIFACETELTGGTLHTKQIAEKMGRPFLVLIKDIDSNPEQKLIQFIEEYKIKTLNVAGPRTSKEPEIYGYVLDILDKII